MGNIIYKKGILLDERDVDDAPHACLVTLAATIEDHLLDEFDPSGDLESGCPELELYGLASERFDTTYMFHEPSRFAPRTRWIKAAGTFHTAFLKQLGGLGLPNPEVILHEGQEAVDAVEPHLREKICAQVMAGDYEAAEDLISDLRALKYAGLPQIRSPCDFDWGSEEAIFDFRTTNHGPGTRILAEIGFNWGQ